MRVSYSFAMRDQNRLVYHVDKQFTASLQAELQPALHCHFARFGLSLADYGPLFEHLRATQHQKERVKIQLAPTNLHCCSDAALELLADLSARLVPAPGVGSGSERRRSSRLSVPRLYLKAE